MEITISPPINQIDRFTAMLPNHILEEELHFYLEAMLTEYFDREFALFKRKSEYREMTEVMLIPLTPLNAMLSGEIKDKLKGLEEWIERKLKINNVEVFLTFEDPPRQEVELYEEVTQAKRAQALMERIAQK